MIHFPKGVQNMEIDGKKLGQRILSARQLKGMKQETLCELAGVSQPRLSAAENGESKFRIDTLYRLAKTLEVPISWLMGENVISVDGMTNDEIMELLKYKELLIMKRK